MDQASAQLLKTLGELETGIASGSDFNMIKAAVILWDWVANSDPLVSKVNRSHHVKLEFTIPITPESDGQGGNLQWLWLEPLVGTAKETVGLDKFLEAKCVQIKEHELTVKDFLLVFGNQNNGIGFSPTHYDYPQVQLDQLLKFGARKQGAKNVQCLAAIILEAIAPLLEKIR